MESDSEDATEYVCPICQRSFNSMAGIRRHWSKGHSDSEIEESVNNFTQNVPTNILSNSVNSQSIPPIISTSSSNATAPNQIVNRVTCFCGFLAKNERGLNIHLRIHNDQDSTGDPQGLPAHFDFDPHDTASIIQKFGELVYKCKCNIPIVRIIQKSVRTAVCQELTKVVDQVVSKNDLLSWCRLLSFPLIVLNTIPKSGFKDNHRPNAVRHNLSIFSKLNNLASLFSELLSLLSYDRPKKPLCNSEKLIIKIAQRKIGEGDISGAVRVLSYQDGVAKR